MPSITHLFTIFSRRDTVEEYNGTDSVGGRTVCNLPMTLLLLSWSRKPLLKILTKCAQIIEWR